MDEAPVSPPAPENTVPVEQLQFRNAEPVSEVVASRRCVACKSPIPGSYYHAHGQVVCPQCAHAIEAGQQAAPARSLGKAALYGGGAALAGCALYAVIAIVTGLELALIAILIGVMVGKAVRHGSDGLGGRPQQILAVALTYFAITTSYIPVFIYKAREKKETSAKAGQQKNAPPAARDAATRTPPPREEPSRMSLGYAIALLLGFAAAAPFISLFSGGDMMGSLLSLLIIFFGLRQAWALAARTELLVMGPYSDEPLQTENAPA